MTASSLMRVVLASVLTFFAFGANADNSWNGYHWARTTSSFTLQTVDSMTPDWDWNLSDSLARWSQTSVLAVQVTSTDDAGKTRKRCPMVQGQMRVCNAAYGFNGWLGLATIGLNSTGHIDRGTAKMNDSYSSYWTPEEKNHVVCQEIGHVLGLDHTTEDGSSQQTCMDYSSDPASQWPNQHDYDMLMQVYAHSDAYNSYDDGSSSGGDGGVCNSPPGKGCNRNGAAVAEVPPMGVRVVRNRYREIWVAPRSDGGLWIHHIHLVPTAN